MTVYLDGWSFDENDLASARSGHNLLNPSLDLGSACNLNCPYCFIEEKNSARKERKPGELTPHEVEAVVLDFLSSGARTVNLVGAGEPTIDPQFRDVVDLTHSGGARTVIFTNGIALADDDALVEWLWTRGATVVLKYNAVTPTLQDVMVGRRGYSSVRDAALCRLIKWGFNSMQPTRLGVDTLACRGNLNELTAIHRWCRRNNVFPMTAEFLPTGRTADGTVNAVAALGKIDPELADRARSALRSLNSQERERLLTDLASVDRECGVEHFGDRAYFGGGPCRQLLGVYVDIIGRIWPCVARSRGASGDSSPLGSVKSGDTASSVWRNSPYLQSIRATYTGACPYKPSLTTGAADSQYNVGLVPLLGVKGVSVLI